MLNPAPDFTPFAAGLLLRVSTPHQAEEGTSLESQERICRDVAARLGVPVVDVYADKGVSGDLYHTRPELQRALSDIRTGRFNLLIAFDQSRVSWSPEYLPRIRRDIEQAGARLYIHLMGGMMRPDDYQQEFAAGVQTQADQFYRRHLRAISIQGHRQAATEGRQPARHVSPQGYHVVTKADVLRGMRGPDGQPAAAGAYLVLEPEAAVIRELFRRYDEEGVSLSELVHDLKTNDVPTKQGGEWTRSSLVRIFHNPIYKGVGRYGVRQRSKDETRIGQESKHPRKPYTSIYTYQFAPEASVITFDVPALVSVEQWERVNALLAANQKKYSGRPSVAHFLAGFIVCPKCGHRCRTMSTANKSKKHDGNAPPYAYYICPHDTMRRALNGEVCSSRCFAAPLCEQLTAQAIQAYVTRPDIMSEAFAAFIEQRKQHRATNEAETGTSERVAQAEDRLRDIDAKRAALLAQSGLDADFFADTLRALSEAHRAAKSDLTTARRERTPQAAPDSVDLQAWQATVDRALTGAERVLLDDRVEAETKRKILRGLVDTVKPRDSGKRKGNYKESNPDAVEVAFLPVRSGAEIVCQVFALKRRRAETGEVKSASNPNTSRTCG